MRCKPSYYFDDPSCEPPRPDPELDDETRLALEALVKADFFVKVTHPDPADPEARWGVTVIRISDDIGESVLAKTILQAAQWFDSITGPV